MAVCGAISIVFVPSFAASREPLVSVDALCAELETAPPKPARRRWAPSPCSA